MIYVIQLIAIFGIVIVLGVVQYKLEVKRADHLIELIHKEMELEKQHDNDDSQQNKLTELEIKYTSQQNKIDELEKWIQEKVEF